MYTRFQIISNQTKNCIKNIKGWKMDLIGGYLLGILVLFAINISLLFGNYEINNLTMLSETGRSEKDKHYTIPFIGGRGP